MDACSACGVAVPEGSKFCNECGASLAPGSGPEVEAALRQLDAVKTRITASNEDVKQQLDRVQTRLAALDGEHRKDREWMCGAADAVNRHDAILKSSRVFSTSLWTRSWSMYWNLAVPALVIAAGKSHFHYDSTDSVAFRACWALENLRPMWWPENAAKGNRGSHPE